MAKKKLTLGMAAAAAAGTVVYVAKKSQDKKNQNGTSQNDIRDKANSGWLLTQHKINSGWTFNKKDDKNSAANNNYRNTERGKYEKNSKGIYYTNGNYEAFARPEKPEGVEEKHQVDFLNDLGCDYIQGYYFGRPMSQDQYEKLTNHDEGEQHDMPQPESS